MKANEAPEKIYINSSLEDRIWLIGKGDTSFIEYTRTDAFLEKACDWMSNHLQNEYGGFSDFIKAFKKAMK